MPIKTSILALKLPDEIQEKLGELLMNGSKKLLREAAL
jgi:hypothetical protein